jgi:hypothetical protein
MKELRLSARTKVIQIISKDESKSVFNENESHAELSARMK